MGFTAEIRANGKTVTTLHTVPVIPPEGLPNELEYWGAGTVFGVNGKRYAVTLYISEEPADTPMDNAWNTLARKKNIKRRSD